MYNNIMDKLNNDIIQYQSEFDICKYSAGIVNSNWQCKFFGTMLYVI